MTVAIDPLLGVRADLAERLDRLAAALPHMDPGQIAHSLDEIRRVARDYGLTPLAELASACESALSGTCSILMLRQWLAAMQEAAGCAVLAPDAARLWLATLGVRFQGG